MFQYGPYAQREFVCDPARNLWAKEGAPSYETINVGCTIYNRCESLPELLSIDSARP